MPAPSDAITKVPATLLLLSPHPQTSDMYACALTKAGFTVETELADSGSPIAVVVHCGPRQDIQSLVADCRKAAGAAPVIGVLSCSCVAREVRAGMFDLVFVLPLAPEELVAALAEILETPKLIA